LIVIVNVLRDILIASDIGELSIIDVEVLGILEEWHGGQTVGIAMAGDLDEMSIWLVAAIDVM
jgi:hypothetical protein